MKNRSFCPAHITGFFRAENKYSDILNKGSIGAGFSIDEGIYTETAPSPKTQIIINSKNKTRKAKVSKIAIKLFNEKVCLHCNYKVIHQINVPTGSGLGTSAAGVISLLYSLNNLHESPLSEQALLELAHKAEILAKTGLGTVLGLSVDGFEIRTKPGAPGVGEVVNFSQNKNLVAVFLINGKIKTKKALKNKKLTKQINSFSSNAINNLLKEFSYQEFLQMANSFTKITKVGNRKIYKMLEHSESLGHTSAMLMFGNGIFTITDKKNAKAFIEKMQERFRIKTSFYSKIYYKEDK